MRAGNTAVAAADDAIGITEDGGSVMVNVTTAADSGVAGDGTARDAGVGGGEDGAPNVLSYVTGNQKAGYPNTGTTPAGTALEHEYGSLTINADGDATYTLDTQCGSTPGIQGSAVDSDEAGDFGCTPNALKAGQVVTDVFTYQVADKSAAAGFMVTMDTALVTVTITGANNDPVLAVSGTPKLNVTEAGATRSADNAANGTFSIADEDTGAGLPGVMADTHSATARTGSSGSFAALPGTGLVGTYGNLTALTVDDAANTVSWTYALDQARAATNALGNVSMDDVFSIRVTDNSTATGSADVTITVTVQGDNDAPTVSLSSTVDDAVTEAGGTGNGTNDNPTATGTVIAMDPDSSPDVNGCLGASCSLDSRSDGMRVGGGTVSATIPGAYGALVLSAPNAGGEATWTYTLDQDHADVEALDGGGTPDTLTETFRFRAFDASGGSVSGGVAHIVMQEITITGANDAPVLGTSPIGVQEANEGQAFVLPITFGPAGNFNDVDGADTALTYTLTAKPAWMNDIASGASQITGRPAAVAAATNVTINASDGALSVNHTFSIAVVAGNPNPNAVADTIAIAEDTATAVTMVTNTGRTDTSNLFDGDGGINDFAGDAATAVLVGYGFGSAYDTATNVRTAAVAGSLAMGSAGEYGTLVVAANGSFSYTLDTARANRLQEGASGTDVFIYRISDRPVSDITPVTGHAARISDGTVTVTIAGSNDAPASDPNDMIAEINEDTPDAGAMPPVTTTYAFNATDLDFMDPDDDPGSDTLNNITITALPVVQGDTASAGTLSTDGGANNLTAGATVSLADLGNLVFTPANRADDYSAVIRYQVTDSSGATDGTATSAATYSLVIPVGADNDAPTGADADLPGIMETATRNFAAADFGYNDPEGAPLDRISISAVTMGSLTIGGAAYVLDADIAAGDISTLVFTPVNRSDDYDATVTFTVHDGANSSAAPNTLTIPVTATDEDPAVVGSYTSPATVGSMAPIADASIPAAGTVFGVTDTEDNLLYTFNCVAAAGNVDTSVCGSSGTAGFLTLAGGVFGGTSPDVTANHMYTVTVTATTDPGAKTATASFTLVVEAGNVKPTANADAIAATEDNGTAIVAKTNGDDSVFDGDGGLTDFEGDAATLVGYGAGDDYDTAKNVRTVAGSDLATGSAGEYGTLVIAADGSFTYTLDTSDGNPANALQGGETAEDEFTYRVSDRPTTDATGHANRQNDGVITVTVTGVNDAPTAADFEAGMVDEDATYPFVVTDTFGFDGC